MLHRNCLLKHIIEGKIERRGERGRRKQLWIILRKVRYWNLKKEALDRNLENFGGCYELLS
jgi:hypothetical protein